MAREVRRELLNAIRLDQIKVYYRHKGTKRAISGEGVHDLYPYISRRIVGPKERGQIELDEGEMISVWLDRREFSAFLRKRYPERRVRGRPVKFPEFRKVAAQYFLANFGKNESSAFDWIRIYSPSVLEGVPKSSRYRILWQVWEQIRTAL